MEKKNTITGICMTCNHLKDCLHRLDNGMTVWYCEQFDDHVPSAQQTFQSFPVKMDKPENIECFQGLCVNCDNRSECLHSRTPGGVWWCDEYR